jgi:hypothetical protein
MWGSRAETYSVKAKKASSMKWHLVDEASLEEREIEVGYGSYKQKTTRIYGALMCAGSPSDWTYRIPLVLKDTVNLNGSGICAYCKNFRLKELGLKEKVMG